MGVYTQNIVLKPEKLVIKREKFSIVFLLLIKYFLKLILFYYQLPLHKICISFWIAYSVFLINGLLDIFQNRGFLINPLRLIQIIYLS